MNATIVDPSNQCRNLEASGAICSNERVVQDGNIITAQGPLTSSKFGIAILKALYEK